MMRKEWVFLKCPVILGSRKKSHFACNHEALIYPSLWRGWICYSSEAFLWHPSCALRMTGRESTGRGYPADACGAICLSFRALGKLSLKIWPTNLEMNLVS